MLPMSVVWSSSGTLTTGRIAYRQEEGDGSEQGGRSAIYDCLVTHGVNVPFFAPQERHVAPIKMQQRFTLSGQISPL